MSHPGDSDVPSSSPGECGNDIGLVGVNGSPEQPPAEGAVDSELRQERDPVPLSVAPSEPGTHWGLMIPVNMLISNTAATRKSERKKEARGRKSISKEMKTPKSFRRKGGST